MRSFFGYGSVLSAVLVWLIPLAAGAHTQIINISEPYINSLIPGSQNTVAYFTLENQSETPLMLVTATTDVAKAADLHVSRDRDGLLSMEPIDQLPIAAGEMVTFAPGGYHVMLLGVEQPLIPGDHVPITLTFEDGREQVVDFRVRDVFADDERVTHDHG